jgi:hypothetical protein
MVQNLFQKDPLIVYETNKMYMSLAQSLDVSLTDNFRKLRSSLESVL